MNKLLPLAGLLAFATAAACPAKPTMFNGSVPATIHGMKPYCSTAGWTLVKAFRDGYIKAGQTVNYVEGYRFSSTDEDAISNALDGMDIMLKSLGYEYHDSAEGEYNTLYIYKKANAQTRGIVISVEVASRDTIFVITNGDFSFFK